MGLGLSHEPGGPLHAGWDDDDEHLARERTEEVELRERYQRAQEQSRIAGAGVLLIPDSLDEDVDGSENPLVAELLDAMTKPVEDPDRPTPSLVCLHTSREALDAHGGLTAAAEELAAAMLPAVADREAEARRLLEARTRGEPPPPGHTWTGEYRLHADGHLELVDVEALPIPGWRPDADPTEITVGGVPELLEVRIGGHAVDPTAVPAVCRHRSFHEQVTFADIVDEAGTLVRRQAKLKARCAECGVPVRFRVDTTGLSRTDGDLGLVVDFEPLEE